MKHLLTVVSVLTWLGMVGLLIQRQMPPPALDLAHLPPPDQAVTGADVQEQWFGVYQGKRKIGHARRAITRTANGWHIEDESRFILAMLGTPQPLSTRLAANTDADWALRRFQFAVDSPAARFVAAGTSDDHHLQLRYGSGERADTLTIPLERPINLSATVRPRIAAAHPSVGERFTHTVFSPFTLRTDTVTTVVEGRETIDGTETLRLVEQQGSVQERVWLEPDGRVAREEGALGLVLKSEPRDVALAGLDDGAPLDLAYANAIPLRGRIPSPRSTAALTLRVSGPAAERVPSDPPRQRVQNDLLRIERETLPEAIAGPPPDARYTAPSPFIESDDPDIVARAKTIVGDETDPVKRARRLVDWIRRHVVQEPTLSVPSARAVLKTLRGDCNEHAVLLVALARAAGIPARVVAGAVHTGEGFFYHAWTELWLGTWVSADAVFDQMPVDATHVKLLEGGPERHLELADVIGRLQFAVVEVRS